MPDDDSQDGATEDTMRTTIGAIRKAQKAQALIEAERTGASKLTAKLLSIFGTLITLGAVAGFVWILDAQAINQRQDSEIDHIEERAREHGHTGVSESVRATDRRVDMISGDLRQTSMRLDKNGERLDELDDEVDALEVDVRRNSNTRRNMSWGD